MNKVVKAVRELALRISAETAFQPQAPAVQRPRGANQVKGPEAATAQASFRNHKKVQVPEAEGARRKSLTPL